MLATFSGETDWSGQLTDEDAVREIVRSLRKLTKRRQILICTYCLFEQPTGA